MQRENEILRNKAISDGFEMHGQPKRKLRYNWDLNLRKLEYGATTTMVKDNPQKLVELHPKVVFSFALFKRTFLEVQFGCAVCTVELDICRVPPELRSPM